MKIIFEQFEGLNQYIDTISSRPINKVFSSRSPASDESGYRFTMTHSYDEACEVARVGYKDGLDQLKAADTKSRHVQNIPKPRPEAGIVGYAPHVPNAITGVPLSMINTQAVEQKAKVISILYYMGGHCGISTSEFVKAGKNILNVVYTLELQGYRVALNVLTNFCERNERALCSVQIKNWRQPSNPLKLAYPLVHPSFFRRHGFRWLETQPDLVTQDFTDGYGRPLDIAQSGNPDARRRWLKEQGILPQGWFYTERVEARDFEANKLIKKMGIEKGISNEPNKKKPPKDLVPPPSEFFVPPPHPKDKELNPFLPPDFFEPKPRDKRYVPYSPRDLRLTAEELYRRLSREWDR